MNWIQQHHRQPYSSLNYSWRRSLIRKRLQSMVAYTDNRVLSAPSLAGRTDHPLRNSELQGDEHGNTAGNEIQQEQDYLIPVSVQFCPTRAQSHILASAGEAGVVEFYDTSDRNKIKECPEKQVWCHQDAIFAVEWSKTGNRLATAGGDHTSAVVDAAKSTVMCYLRGHKGSLRSLKWSDINQDNILVTAARDGYIHLYDLRSKGTSNFRTPQCSIPAHCDLSAKASKGPCGVSSVDMLHSCNLLISGSSSNEAVKLWDMRMLPLGAASQTHSRTSRCAPVQTLGSSSSRMEQMFPKVSKASRRNAKFSSVPSAMEHVLGQCRSLNYGFIPRNGKYVKSHDPCLSPFWAILEGENAENSNRHSQPYTVNQMTISSLLWRYGNGIHPTKECLNCSLKCPATMVENAAKMVLDNYDSRHDFIRLWTETFGDQCTTESVISELQAAVEAKEIKSVPQSCVSVLNLQVSPDRHNLLVNYSNNSIRVYNLSRPREFEYEEYVSNDPINSFNRACWDPTGNYIAATCGQTLRIWEHKYRSLPICSLYTDESKSETSPDFPWITGISWRSDGCALAHCGDDQHISVLHLPSTSFKFTKNGNGAAIPKLYMERHDEPSDHVRDWQEEMTAFGRYNDFCDRTFKTLSDMKRCVDESVSAILSNAFDEAFSRLPLNLTKIDATKRSYSKNRSFSPSSNSEELPIAFNFVHLRWIYNIKEESLNCIDIVGWLTFFWVLELSKHATPIQYSQEITEMASLFLKAFAVDYPQEILKPDDHKDQVFQAHCQHLKEVQRNQSLDKHFQLRELEVDSSSVFSTPYSGQIVALFPVSHHDVIETLCMESSRYIVNRNRIIDFFQSLKGLLLPVTPERKLPSPTQLCQTPEDPNQTDISDEAVDTVFEEPNSLKRSYRGTLSSLWGLPSPKRRKQKYRQNNSRTKS